MLNLESFYLPPLPEALLSCILYMYKNDFNYEVLIKKITTDIGLTEKIFTVANSQYFAQGAGPTDNLKQAIIRIGVNSLLKILTNEYYKTNFGKASLDFFTLRDLNLHSSYVSHMVVMLAKYVNLKDTNDLMIAGLFHDIGLIARFHCEKDVMETLVKKCKVNKIDFYTAEKAEGLDTHDTIGKIIAKKWNLGERVAFLIEHHHTPESQRVAITNYKLYQELDILMFADIIAHKMKFGYSEYGRETKVSQYFLDRLGLTAEVVAKMANETLKAIMTFDF